MLVGLNMQLRIVTGTWEELAQDAMLVREAVFIQEQHIAEQDEWDEHDALALHFVVYNHLQAIATARLLTSHHIGRVAVIATERGKGIGQYLMQAVMDTAHQQQRPYVQLSSQVHAMAFYQNLGFVVRGTEYLDCAIPHIDMYSNL